MRTRMADWLSGTDEAPLALPPYLASFAKKASGGGSDEDPDDEDPDDEDPDDEDPDDEDDDEDPDADKTDEELREELKTIRESLKKANGQSAARRKKLREREAELEAERKKPKAKPAAKKDADAEAPDLDAIRDEAKREAKVEADNRIKRSEAKAALVAAGVTREVAADLIGFVKFDELDVEGDEVEGLDEEIDRIKAKYPTFFAKGRRRRESVAGDGDRDGGKPRKKPMTASEKQAARLAG